MTSDDQPLSRGHYEAQIVRGGRVRLSLSTAVIHSMVAPYLSEFRIDAKRDLLHIPFDISSIGVPFIPPAYGIKGGGARLALAEALGISAREPKLRDLDLFRIGTRWSPLDSELAERFMEDDLRNGHGVELVSTLEGYFSTRDLTLNQIAWMDGVLICAPLAMFDMVCRVLRPCRYFAGTLHRSPSVRSITIAKMYRFRAERGAEWDIDGIPPHSSIDPFDMAVHLDRALARSRATGIRYLEELVAAKHIFPHEERGEALLEEMVAELSELLDDGRGFFKHLGEEPPLSE
jgi:hypothetical protein